MVRAWIWSKTLWESEDLWYDRLARRAPVRAAVVIGLAFGLLVWLLADAVTWSVLPFDAFVGPAIVGALTYGPVLVWLRRRRT